MNLKDLKLGEQYVTGDSYGYALVEITKEAYNNPKQGPNWLEVEAKLVSTGQVDTIGYDTGYAYIPYIELFDVWISRYAPELREEMKRDLI